MENERELHVHFHFDGLTINVVHSADSVLTSLIHLLKKDILMATASVQEGLDRLALDITALTAEDQKAIALIQSIPGLIAAAVAAAQAAGATPAQLAAFDDLSATIEKNTADLAAVDSPTTP